MHTEGPHGVSALLRFQSLWLSHDMHPVPDQRQLCDLGADSAITYSGHPQMDSWDSVDASTSRLEECKGEMGTV